MKLFCKFFGRAVFLAISFFLYQTGLAEEVSSISDYETLRASAESGDAQSQYLLGRRFCDGTEETGKDYLHAVEWFRKAAESGHGGAQTYLGYILTVVGFSTDPAEGFKWLRRAAETNEVWAQNYLGYCYEMGRFIQPDRFEAMDWYIKAAAQGNTKAETSLERLRRTADVARKGPVPDEWWMIPLDELIQKAEQGDVAAQYNLGRRYTGYGGTAVDMEKAMDWLEKAATQTDQAARYSLSQLYVSTTNIVPEKAFHHCSIAAEGGYSRAQRELGEYYRDGFGIAPDRAKAFHWFCLAEQSGDDYAKVLIHLLIKGRAKFKEVRKGRLDVEDYSSPPVEMVVCDLDNQERTVKFIKYDPKTKQVQTDCQFGESTLLPLSAFSAESYPVIQNTSKAKVLESGLRVEITKKDLSKADCEELGFICGKKGVARYKYDGVVYQLDVSSRDDFLVFQNLDIESRCYYEKAEWSSTSGKKGIPKETQKYDKKSYKVTKLIPGTTYDFETDPLVVESYDTDRGIYYKDGSPTIVDSKILGVRVRVSCEMADGATVYRDFFEPSALKSKTSW